MRFIQSAIRSDVACWYRATIKKDFTDKRSGLSWDQEQMPSIWFADDGDRIRILSTMKRQAAFLEKEEYNRYLNPVVDFNTKRVETAHPCNMMNFNNLFTRYYNSSNAQNREKIDNTKNWLENNFEDFTRQNKLIFEVTLDNGNRSRIQVDNLKDYWYYLSKYDGKKITIPGVGSFSMTTDFLADLSRYEEMKKFWDTAQEKMEAAKNNGVEVEDLPKVRHPPKRVLIKGGPDFVPVTYMMTSVAQIYDVCNRLQQTYLKSKIEFTIEGGKPHRLSEFKNDIGIIDKELSR